MEKLQEKDKNYLMVKSTGLIRRAGYYVCTSGERERLHVAVWKDKWKCDVPIGCVIHHLDWNKSHNDANNLICVTVWEHEKIHNTLGGEEGKAYGYSLVSTRACGVPPDIYVDK